MAGLTDPGAVRETVRETYAAAIVRASKPLDAA